MKLLWTPKSELESPTNLPVWTQVHAKCGALVECAAPDLFTLSETEPGFYFECPHCGEKAQVGQDLTDAITKDSAVPSRIRTYEEWLNKP